MYSILLVEDEAIELDTLKNYVDWKGLGIDTVFTARGGRSALEIINSEDPDIVITDIQMPGMTGIELVEILRQEGHRCKVVFLTGYDRFEYAKEAIRLQVEDFLLKPFQIEEVEAVVKKLLEKVEKEEQERLYNRLALGKVLERACLGDLQELEQMSDFYFYRPAEQVSVHLIAFRGISESMQQRARKNADVLHTFTRERLLFVLLPGMITPDLFLKKIEKSLQEEAWQVICCDEAVHLPELQAVFDKILVCENDLFYAGVPAVLACRDHVERGPYEDRIRETTRKKVILEAVLAGQKEKAVEFLEHTLALFTDLDRDGFCQNAFSLFLYIHRELDTIGNLDGPAEVPNILHAERMEEVRENLIRYIEQCCESCGSRGESRWSACVYEFVGQNYMKDCTVEEMAEVVNVSPNYLRKKFKEETGMTILEYITETRLSRAAQMLEQRNMKVKDVSISVGYPNISYFTQLFSKKYGVTPNEYRKNA
ncbi:MAG: response regulator [Lachnospiraceae bacterium]|nr:response regulator [Lachnospiraceae bacterium]